jgi:tetratricopeptide (TPR) repeat protein
MHPSIVLAIFTISFVLAIGTSCAPPPEPRQPLFPLARRLDSLEEARARDSSPAWRVDHFFTPALHGPFPRPKLPAGADPNDAAAYYRLGDSVGFRQQGLADRAFFWATRLDPTMADAYYARWDLRSHGSGQFLYPGDSVRRGPKRSPNDAVDSLRVIAFMLDPFLDAALDIPVQIRNLKEWQADRDPATSGLWAYAMGNYTKAVKKFAEGIRKKPQYVGLHFPRAYAWVHLQESDSAVADLTALINRIERIEDSAVTRYLSKEFLYYAIGMLRGGQKRYPEARAAYESAVVENLGFYMAHLRLAAINMFLHDTATALNELETASLMRSDDPVLLAFRGQILLGQHRLDEAQDQLRAAIHADTDFALSYAFVGHVAEERHDTTRALNGYREYLARASHTAPERAWVEDRLARLTTESQHP